MKKSKVITAASLLAMSFCKFASPAALSARCTHFDSEDNTPNVIKVVVADDWKKASVSSPDEDALPIMFQLTCDGPKSMKEEFKCSLFLEFAGVGYNSINFLRDTQNKMTLVAEAKFYNEEETYTTTTFDCVKEYTLKTTS